MTRGGYALTLVLAAGLALAAELLVSRHRIHEGGVTVLDRPQPLDNFSLAGSRGRPIGIGRLFRRWTLLLFGSPECSGACGETLATLARMEETLLGRDGRLNIQVLFVAEGPMDPGRLAERLGRDSRLLLGAGGTTDAVGALASQLGASPSSPDTVYFIDPLARLRATFFRPRDAGALGADVLRIRERYKEACCVIDDKEGGQVVFIRGRTQSP